MAEKYSATEELVLNKHKGTNTIPSKKVTPTIPRESVEASAVIKLERAKDVSNPNRQRLAEEVKKNTEVMLKGAFKGDKIAEYELKVYVVVASDGSSAGRIWAGELGCGWVKLSLAWILTKKENGEAVGYGRFNETDSGACGLADVCNRKYGEDTLTCKLTDKAVNKIIKSVSTGTS